MIDRLLELEGFCQQKAPLVKGLKFSDANWEKLRVIINIEASWWAYISTAGWAAWCHPILQERLQIGNYWNCESHGVQEETSMKTLPMQRVNLSIGQVSKTIAKTAESMAKEAVTMNKEHLDADLRENLREIDIST